jgi:hypothetical protein
MSGVPSVIPKDLIGTDAPLNSVPIKRVPVSQLSDQNTYSPGAQVIFTFPADMCDFRQAYISFFAQATGGGGTYLRFSYPISTMFNRLRVELGSQVLVDIQDYNVLRGIFVLAENKNAVDNVTQEGSTVDATRAAETIAGRLYCVRTDKLDLLNRVWPLNRIRLPLRIVLTIEPSYANFMEYDGTGPTAFTFSNANFNFHSLQCPQVVYDMIDASIASGRSQIKAHGWDNYATPVATASTQSIMLPFKYKYLNSLLAVYRLQSASASPTQVGKFVNIFNASATESSLYAKIGNTIYPQNRYDLSAGSSTNQGVTLLQPPFAAIMEDEFHANIWGENMYMAAAPLSRVVVPFNLYGDPEETDDIFRNGVDTASSATSSLLNLTFWGASGALNVDVFAKYEQVITILPNGNVNIDQ